MPDLKFDREIGGVQVPGSIAGEVMILPSCRGWRGERPRWRRGGCDVCLAARPLFAQFTSRTHAQLATFSNNWQSCREADGRYSERVYDHLVNGVPGFEVHMARGASLRSSTACDDTRARSPANLLRSYRLEVEGNSPPMSGGFPAQPHLHRDPVRRLRGDCARELGHQCCSRRPASPSSRTSSRAFRTARSLLPVSTAHEVHHASPSHACRCAVRPCR
mgnify:CR=1 FL=1